MSSQGHGRKPGRAVAVRALTLLGWLAVAALAPRAGWPDESDGLGLPPAAGIPSAAALTAPDPPAALPAVPGPLTGPALRLVLFDVQQAAPGAYPTMAREVSRLFRDLHVEVSWRRAKPGDISGPDETQVILMDSDGESSGQSRQVLGATRKHGLRAVWVYLPNVTLTLGIRREAAAWSLRQREELACALGRVIAHELIHVVAPDRPHSSTGLMSSKLDRGLLVSPGVRLDPATRLALAEALLAGREPTVPAAASAEPAGPASPN